MIDPYRLNQNNKDIGVISNFELYNQIETLRSEVRSLQKSVALVLRCLPYVVHDELVNHECKCDNNRGSFPL